MPRPPTGAPRLYTISTGEACLRPLISPVKGYGADVRASHGPLSRSQMHFKTGCYLQKTTVKHPPPFHKGRICQCCSSEMGTDSCVSGFFSSDSRTLFVCFGFFGHIIAKRANNQGPFCLYSLFFFFLRSEGQPRLSLSSPQ